jgi:hypothetical protein
MTTFKWLAFMSAMGFAFCGAVSLFMPPPPNPPVAAALSIASRMQVPADVQAVLKRSCYDCHSNETRWPAYSRLWPASALMYSDVSKGRGTMNFSDWPKLDDPNEARRAAGLLMASCAAIGGGLMPRKQYLMLHPEAKVSPEDTRRFCAWSSAAATSIRSTLAQR